MLSTSLARPKTWFAFPAQVHPEAARLTAMGVVALLAIAAALRAPWLVMLVAVDFLLRSLAGPRLSPLGRLSQRLIGTMPKPAAKVPGRPKQLAALTGTLVLGFASVAFALGYGGLGWTATAVLMVFASLEAVFSFCAVCRLYDLVVGCPACATATAPDNDA